MLRRLLCPSFLGHVITTTSLRDDATGINVADYLIVSIGMRILLGVLTGNACIDAQVAYTNLRDATKFGAQPYDTASSAWGGVFAKVTPQQVDQIATSVLAERKAAK